jgi:hypothetical protein
MFEIEYLCPFVALDVISPIYLFFKRSQGGVYTALQLSIADCALAPNDVVSSFISRGATTPSGAGAKEVTFIEGI